MLSKLSYRILRKLDEQTLAKYLNFGRYFSIHKFFGFPLKRLGFFHTQGYRLDLNNPVTFNEKVVHRHLFERDPLLPMIVDKYAVREYVKEKIGEKYLIPLLQVADSFDEIDFSRLPDDYVMKMTHASGENIIVKDRKNNHGYDREELKRTFESWFTEKYRYQSLIWFVQPIKRKVIIEELLRDDDGKIPKDYKFFVFDGKVEFIQVDQERFLNHTQNYYDKNWKRTSFTWRCPTGEIDEKPALLESMIKLAETLGSDFTFMRIDFYNIGTKIYFGELTPCPGGGTAVFNPKEYDKYYGDKWKNYTNLMRKS